MVFLTMNFKINAKKYVGIQMTNTMKKIYRRNLTKIKKRQGVF